MGPKTTKLVLVLEELEMLLQEQGETLWKDWFSTARARLNSSGFSGIEKVLLAYGGMGSFNDLIVGYYIEDGIINKRNSYWRDNQRLNELRKSAWELATEIKREFDISNT